ncbi:MAG: FAD-dependent oxidoreductase [Phaeodactylibacter sp.]|uniref:NAD(P)/FAD-dependent oxidoreductase n=1 Tax=Phaeodactylibacter sp. TaxID=1940289 RepID=UPI0032EAECA2
MPKQSSIHYQLSYWEHTSFFSNIDLLIVGAGIVGLSAALRARERAPKAKILVLERGPLPVGASTRNAGFACFGSVSELLDDMQQDPEDEVWALVERRWKGLLRLRGRLGDTAIRYEPLGGYELFRPEEVERYETCASHIAAFNQSLQPITGLKATYQLAHGAAADFGLNGVRYLIKNQAEGQLHTGELVKALLEKVQAAGITIYTGLGVEALHDTGGGVEVETASGWSINAGQVLVCTNGFAPQLLPGVEVRPARNQVLITQPVPQLKVKGAFHYDRGYFYFRNIDNRILLGGGRNLAAEAETTSTFGTTPLIRAALVRLLQEVILPGQEVEVARWWSGILGVGQRKRPIIEPVSSRVAAAVRLGGMGVAIGALVGEEGADLLLG